MDPVKAFIEDIKNYRTNDEISDKLYSYVWSAPGIPRTWYMKLSDAMKDQEKTLDSPEKVSSFVMNTVFGLYRPHTLDIEAFLRVHRLPRLPRTADFPEATPLFNPVVAPIFQLNTLPVLRLEIGNGASFRVSVKVNDMKYVPERVVKCYGQYERCINNKRFDLAAVAQYEIEFDSFNNRGPYRLLNTGCEMVLTRSYNIVLKGLSVPKKRMDYHQEAQLELRRAISKKCVTVAVFKMDKSNRCVSDVFWNGELVQEILLKKGAAWHCPMFDNREKFKQLHDEAKAKKIGLWSKDNPTAPWEWNETD